jgi:hypothetical protein
MTNVTPRAQRRYYHRRRVFQLLAELRIVEDNLAKTPVVQSTANEYSRLIKRKARILAMIDSSNRAYVTESYATTEYPQAEVNSVLAAAHGEIDPAALDDLLAEFEGKARR